MADVWHRVLMQVALVWRPMLIQAALTFVAALGAFQVAALRNGLEGLAWPVGLRHKRFGYFLAGLLLVIALLGGVLLALLNVPLPPLLSVTVFLAGSGLALPLLVVGAALRLLWRKKQQQPPPPWGRPIQLGPLRATFYQPAGRRGPFPALCLLPDPTASGDNLSLLVQALVEGGIAVLALDLQSLDTTDRLTLQGLVSVGVSHLAQRPETDAERVGLVGIGLGGDLVLRGAAMDPGMAATLAIEPVLSSDRPGLGLETLRDLSWFEAQRRAHRWRHSALVKGLDAPTAIRRIISRPVAIVVGCASGPDTAGSLEILRVDGGCPLTPAAHTEALKRAAEWLMEHLT